MSDQDEWVDLDEQNRGPGRPAMSGVKFLAYVSEYDNQRLLAIKRRCGLPRAEIIRRAVTAYLDQYDDLSAIETIK